MKELFRELCKLMRSESSDVGFYDGLKRGNDER
jgi:hypothetical protein